MKDKKENQFVIKEHLDVSDHVIKPIVFFVLAEFAFYSVQHGFEDAFESMGSLIIIALVLTAIIWVQSWSELGQISIVGNDIIYGVGNKGKEVWRTNFDQLVVTLNETNDIQLSTLNDSTFYKTITIERNRYLDFELLESLFIKLQLFTEPTTGPQRFGHITTLRDRTKFLLWGIGFMGFLYFYSKDFEYGTPFTISCTIIFSIAVIRGIIVDRDGSIITIKPLSNSTEIKTRKETWTGALSALTFSEEELPDTFFLHRENRQLTISTPAGESITLIRNRFRDYDRLVRFLNEDKERRKG